MAEDRAAVKKLIAADKRRGITSPSRTLDDPTFGQMRARPGRRDPSKMRSITPMDSTESPTPHRDPRRSRHRPSQDMTNPLTGDDRKMIRSCRATCLTRAMRRRVTMCPRSSDRRARRRTHPGSAEGEATRRCSSASSELRRVEATLPGRINLFRLSTFMWQRSTSKSSEDAVRQESQTPAVARRWAAMDGGGAAASVAFHQLPWGPCRHVLLRPAEEALSDGSRRQSPASQDFARNAGQRGVLLRCSVDPPRTRAPASR